jgi:hypothetical protein
MIPEVNSWPTYFEDLENHKNSIGQAPIYPQMYTEPIDAVVREFPLPEHSYQLIQEISLSELK